MAFTVINVTAEFLLANRTPATGFIDFLLSSQLKDSVNDEIIGPIKITKELDSLGFLNVNLVANTDSTTSPSNTYYTVTERITGAPERTYDIILSHTLLDVNLADVAPISPGPPVTSYVLQTSFDAHVGSTNPHPYFPRVATYTITGDGTSTSFNVPHNKNTRDVMVYVYEAAAPYEGGLLPDWYHDTVNVVRLVFSSAPANGKQYKILILWDQQGA